MSSPQTTPLSELLSADEMNRKNGVSPPSMQQPPPPQQVMSQTVQDPTRQFSQLPDGVQTKPVTREVPSGVGQGLSMPTRKEFFGLKDFDYKTVVLVFSVILLLTSGSFSSALKAYIPSAVEMDGRNKLAGSFIAASIGTILYIVIKMLLC